MTTGQPASPPSMLLRIVLVSLSIIVPIAGHAINETIESLRLVNTTSGIHRGTYNESAQVFRFAGIRYAAPPIGQLRFAPPVLASPPPATLLKRVKRHGPPTVEEDRKYAILDASRFGHSCHQDVTYGTLLNNLYCGLVAPSSVSEDCLSINVWSSYKSISRRDDPVYKGSPIMLYIHGGSFTHRTSADPHYEGTEFVKRSAETASEAEYEEPVIVMTINYRLSIFGFPGAPQIIKGIDGSAASVNVGLLDFELALAWIKINAKTFGGDPQRIVLWGQSAGASAIDAWTYSHAGTIYGTPSARGTGVVGTIVESGVVQGLGFFVQSSAAKNTELLREYTSVSLPDRASHDTVPRWTTIARRVGCGRHATSAQLECMRAKSWRDLMSAVNETQATFAPVPDGKTWFTDFYSRSRKGMYARTPMLLGTNTDESNVLWMSANKSGDARSPMPPPDLKEKITTDLVFKCPAIRAAEERAKYGVPVYRYSYGGVWDDIVSGRPLLGSSHGSEVAVVFGTFGPTPVAAATNANLGPPTVDVPAAEVATSRFLMDMWAAFARDPVSGLSRKGWPRYPAHDANKVASVAAIAINNSPITKYLTSTEVDNASCVISDSAIESVESLLYNLTGLV